MPLLTDGRGFPEEWIRHGVPTTTAVGYGSPFVDGPGSLMNLGVGSLITTAAGTGAHSTAGTGYLDPFGDPVGSVGTGARITSAGHQ